MATKPRGTTPGGEYRPEEDLVKLGRVEYYLLGMRSTGHLWDDPKIQWVSRVGDGQLISPLI